MRKLGPISEAAARELMLAGTRRVCYESRPAWMSVSRRTAASEQRWGSAGMESSGLKVEGLQEDGDFEGETMRADESGMHLDLEKAALEVVEWGRAHDEASAAPQTAGDDAGQQQTLHQELTLHQGSAGRELSGLEVEGL